MAGLRAHAELAGAVTADDVRDALRKRHPAVDGPMVGPWTTLVEYKGIDLLAVAAWSSLGFRRVGYEVKISRGDLRRELLKPRKRASAVGWCHEFYFALPAGLMTPEEMAWREPEWEPGDFNREPCPEVCYRPFSGKKAKRGREHKIEIPEAERDPERPWQTHRHEWIECATCGGTGHLEKSRVEREAPTLWIPRDVGLIVVTAQGCSVVKKAPLRKATAEERRVDAALADLARWASVRPDPRHVEAFLRLHDAHLTLSR